MSWIIKGGRLVDPSQQLDAVRDLRVEGGRVAEIGEGLEAGGDTQVLDASGLVVTPGLIDVHVHLREPGQEYKETIETGTMAAAAGGFTAVACMANTNPVNDSRSVTEHILSQARRHGYARVYPVAALSKGMKGEEMTPFGELVDAGVVAFSDDGLPVEHPELLRRAFLYARHFDVPVVQHAEDLRLTGSGVMHEGRWSTRLGLPGIPGIAEDVMIARDLMLAEETGGRYHVQHLSTARGLELINQARSRGVQVTCEVSPHHLLLTDEEIHRSGFSTAGKMKPPLRSEADRQALFDGLLAGEIEFIASDHAPHHVDEKDQPFHVAPYGIVGLETTLGLCLDRLVRPGHLSLSRLIELLSTEPARCFNLPGGSLEVGRVADVTLIDPEKDVTVEPERFRSKGRSTPFAGWTLRGAAVGTLLAGKRVELPAT